MWILRIAAVLAAACIASTAPAGNRAAADVLVIIDKASQRMSVAVNGRTRYIWPVSTGRAGYGTPSGRFRPQWMARTYFSKKYYDSPMPHSIFFHHGFAIHGTEYIHRLGGPASHGCVRLHPHNAATLYVLVQSHGMHNTRIVIGDSIALTRPERWSANERNELKFITLMTDRLMLAEQIERKEALAKMEQMRASDALRRILLGRTREEEPAVAIGVQAEDRAAIPASVKTLPSPKPPAPAAPPVRQAEQRKPQRAVDATHRAKPPAGHRAATPRKQPAAAAPGRRRTVEDWRRRRVEPKPTRRPAHAEQRRQKVSAPQRPAPRQRQAEVTRR